MGVIYLHSIPYGKGSGSGGTSDYNELINKPTLNGNTIVGNQTTDDLDLADETSITYDPTGKLSINSTTNTDIDSLFP